MRDTIDMARKAAAMHGHTFKDVPEQATIEFIEAFAELVRADERENGRRWFDAVTAQHKQLILAEREACAKVCDDFERNGAWVTKEEAAAAIRNRGNT